MLSRKRIKHLLLSFVSIDKLLGAWKNRKPYTPKNFG